MAEENGKSIKDGIKKGAGIVGKIIKWFFIILAIVIALIIGYSVFTCSAVTKAIIEPVVQSDIVQNTVKDAVKEATGQIPAIETNLDGQEYTQIDPKQLAFNIDTGTLKIGDRYVFDDTCFGVKGATLMLTDVGVMNQITLSEFADYSMGKKLRVYVVVDDYTPSIKMAKFKSVKIFEL